MVTNIGLELTSVFSHTLHEGNMVADYLTKDGTNGCNCYFKFSENLPYALNLPYGSFVAG